tara:strand:+ start:162 stop:314 length:153 start_codon:yes stop_codon:yes gene_type:complete
MWSYLYREHYWFKSQLVELIEGIRIEREAKRKNEEEIETTFAEDLLMALQ